MNPRNGISDEVYKLLEFHHEEEQRLNLEVTKNWCTEHNITLKLKTIQKLAEKISMPPGIRTEVSKIQKGSMIDHLTKESEFIAKLLHFLHGPSNQKMPYMRRLKEHILLFKGGRKDVISSLSKLKSMNAKAIDSIKSKRSGPRKDILYYLPQVFEALKDKDQVEQIRAVQELFLKLGYTNRSGKNDPKSVYNDIAEMKTEIEVLENQKKVSALKKNISRPN